MHIKYEPGAEENRNGSRNVVKGRQVASSTILKGALVQVDTNASQHVKKLAIVGVHQVDSLAHRCSRQWRGYNQSWQCVELEF